MKEFIKRTLTGVGFVFIMVWTILWSSISLYILLLTISSIALYEFYSIFKSKNYNPFSAGGIMAGASITSIIFFVRQYQFPDKYLLLIMLPISAILLSFFVIKREHIIDSVMVTLFGLVYILLPISLIPFITDNALTNGFEPQIFLGTLIIIWIYDSAAYICGLLFGKHKMAPSLSPKKTWEGFTGGAVFAVLSSVLISRYFILLNQSDWMILSIIIILSSTAGDLFESLIKREAGIKDSGKFLPGHGGIMDRFDSVFISIPFVFLYIILIKI